MTTGKKAAVTIVCVAAAAALGFGGFMLWKKNDAVKNKGKVYVTQVSDVNTAGGLSLSGSRFSGVIEAQATEDFKVDSDKTVASVEVEVGDEIKVGDVLFTYDVEEMQLKLDEGKIEVERMENEVETTNLQIEELEKEKKAASQDGQTSLNMQILSLQSDVAKAEYDIKAKKAENKKIKKSIGNAEVVSTVDGTVKTVQDADSLAYSDSNVLVSISKGGNYRVKGTVNEQLIGNIYQGMPVIIRSRVDDTATWSGVISEIDTNPQSSSDEDYYSDGDDSSSSKYSFYVEPDSLDGLMLGQHIIIEPDTGETEDGEKIEKKGIWLYSDYVFEENGKSYVWVRNSKEKMEKREVEIGQRDDSTGDCEIASGLEKDDYIAYPSADIVEGMTGTTDADDPDIAEQDYGDDYADDTYGEDYADYGEDGNYEDGDAEYYGEDSVYDDGDVEYDGEDGYYGDEDGEFEDTGIGED